MTRLRFCLFAAILCSLTVLGLGDITMQKPVTIPVPTSAKVETTKLDPANTTVNEKPAEAPTTETTPAPTTDTTPAPTTTTSTTAKPTPPTTPAPTPTPAPGPLPPPQQGKWWYTDKSNQTCILIKFAAQLNVTYTKAVNSSTSLAHVLLNVPTTAMVVDGNCNGTTQWLNLSWPVSNASDTTFNNMVLVFNSNDTTKTYALKYLNVSLAAEVFPDASSNSSVNLWHDEQWRTALSTSYRCTPATQLNMTHDSVVATITISQLQEEAFRNSTSMTFSAARECGGGDLPDAVPIAVGCALGGLVVVVLVAYLVGRRRSAARGYLSM